MIIEQPYPFTGNKWNIIFTTFFCLAGVTLGNIGLDYVFTQFRNSSFYFSESLLFSGLFWVLFFPWLFVITKLVENELSAGLALISVSSIIIIHLFAYPALVWLFSTIFFYQPFSYWQTFSFSLSSYFITTVIIYTVVYTFLAIRKKQQSSTLIDAATREENFISSIVVVDSHNKKLILATNDIFYFSANPPYVNIYHLTKKYLHTGTLKSLEAKLNDQQFVRIHKSFIVNLSKITSIQSRQNGDYDISLADESVLRVSRNYAKSFKSRFSAHLLTAK